MHNNCDYQSIADKLKRRRTTIFQSVKPLLREGYLEQHRVDPTQRNSKVVLSLSRKGKDYVWGKRYLVNIPIRFKDIFSTETDSIILEYLQVLEKVNDSSLQVDMMDQLEYYLFSAPISNKKRSTNSEDKISAVNKAFFQGLLEIAQNPDYDLRILFNPTTIKWLNNIYNLEDRIYMKGYFQGIAQNYETIVKGIDKTLPK